jgi:hypothetical protein
MKNNGKKSYNQRPTQQPYILKYLDSLLEKYRLVIWIDFIKRHFFCVCSVFDWLNIHQDKWMILRYAQVDYTCKNGNIKDKNVA